MPASIKALTLCLQVLLTLSTSAKLHHYSRPGTLTPHQSHTCTEPWEILSGHPITGYTCIPHCTPSPTSCSFYPCISRQFSCSASDFPIAYGWKYCQAFADAAPKYSPAGQKWQLGVRECLQEALMPDVKANNVTCKEIAQHAVRSHARCYVRNGVCDLEWGDRRWIMRTVGWGPWLQEPVGTVRMVGEMEVSCAGVRAGRVYERFLKGLWE